MLQPLQIEDVSFRYANEIRELREFLVKAGFVVETAETLGNVVARLPRDRAFRRDLTSHVWVLIDGGDRQISFSDLLGVVAIAAAGTRFAAAADEKDAHDLLRFLMEARRSLDMAPEKREVVPVLRDAAPVPYLSPKPTEPLKTVTDRGQEVFRAPIPPLHTEVDSIEMPPDGDGKRRRILWVAVAACLLMALSIGLWLNRRPAADVSNTPVSVPPAPDGTVGTNSLPEKNSASSSLSSSEAATTTGMHSPNEMRNSRQTPTPAPYTSAHPSDAPTQATTDTTRGPVSTQAMGSVPTPAWTARSSVSSVTPPPAPRVTGIANHAPVGVSAATLSKNLGSRSVPTDSAAAGDDSAAANRPHLLRRRPLAPSSAFSEDQQNLVAAIRPADVSATSGTSHVGDANVTPGGTVLPTSLGIMAANVLYSPAPTYPAAASAAHVQGAVTLRADVDRDGNVASVRVISGPPLLRDAALDAVQHWRYRPYMGSGKPMPMTAMAIMDFQLP